MLIASASSKKQKMINAVPGALPSPGPILLGRIDKIMSSGGPPLSGADSHCDPQRNLIYS